MISLRCAKLLLLQLLLHSHPTQSYAQAVGASCPSAGATTCGDGLDCTCGAAPAARRHLDKKHAQGIHQSTRDGKKHAQRMHHTGRRLFGAPADPSCTCTVASSPPSPSPHSKRTSLVLELVTRGFLVTSKTSKRSTTRLVCVRYFLLRLYLHTKKTLTQCECRAVQIGSVGGGMSCQWIPPICIALYSHEVKIL